MISLPYARRRTGPDAETAQPAGAPRLAGLAPALVVLCVAGLALRIVAARGDLWLDEIWSFLLAAHVSLADIVVALPYDNNHVLTTLWLKLIGPEASSELARAPAVLLGVLAIPVAARLGARVSPVAALATATIVALDYTFVHFGSEARGYAGLILGFLVALDAVETRLQDDSSRSSLAILALAVAFGTFSHLTMLEASGLLCVVAATRLILAKGVRGAWPRGLAPIVLAVAAGSLPAVACFVVSVMAAGPLHVGRLMPFTLATFVDGLGQMTRATLGFWDFPLSPAAVAIILPLLGLGVAATLALVPRERRVLPGLGILGLPLLHIALHLPNQVYARFHLATGICLALFMAELWARAWVAGRGARAVALAAVLVFATGQILELSRFAAEGRGDFAAATAMVTRQGAAHVAVLPSVVGPETLAAMRWYVSRAQATADVTLAPTPRCARPLPIGSSACTGRTVRATSAKRRALPRPRAPTVSSPPGSSGPMACPASPGSCCVEERLDAGLGLPAAFSIVALSGRGLRSERLRFDGRGTP